VEGDQATSSYARPERAFVNQKHTQRSQAHSSRATSFGRGAARVLDAVARLRHKHRIDG